MDEQIHGPLYPALATTLDNLGMIDEREADFDGAAANYERALIIQERAGKSHGALTTRIRNNYGVTHDATPSTPEVLAWLAEHAGYRAVTRQGGLPHPGSKSNPACRELSYTDRAPRPKRPAYCGLAHYDELFRRHATSFKVKAQ